MQPEIVDLTALGDGGIGREIRGLRGIGALITDVEGVISGEMAEDVGIAIEALAESAWDRVCELSRVVPYRHTESEGA